MALLIQERFCEFCEEVVEICHTCGRCKPHCTCGELRDFDSEFAALVELTNAQRARTEEILSTLNAQADEAVREVLEGLDRPRLVKKVA